MGKGLPGRLMKAWDLLFKAGLFTDLFLPSICVNLSYLWSIYPAKKPLVLICNIVLFYIKSLFIFVPLNKEKNQ